MTRRLFLRSFIVVLLLVALFGEAASVFAGTTGRLSGTAIDTVTNKPIAGAKVTAASPSQVATVTTDASGHYSFLALAPDTYTVSIDAPGFEPVASSGVNVIADQVRTLSLSTRSTKELRTIGRVTTRAATSLVRPGTTADVYSVDATQQAKVTGVGGGAEQNQAYSAVATVPGAYVPQGVQGGNGIGANVYIRGGDYDQVGFEVDGVPVNRSFDNYPSGPAAILGQQELQVYTGAAPAGAEAQGLAGFINQVIKVGTYPSFGNGSLAVGGPAFYHQGSIEFGGATANRNFTYYIGTNGYNQDFRNADQFQGASLTNSFGTPLVTCDAGPMSVQTPANAPTCFNAKGQNYAAGVAAPSFLLGPYNAFNASQIKDRDSVINLHFGIPHKDGSKDDIQFLGVQNLVSTQFNTSTNDLGGVGTLGSLGYPLTYPDGYAYSGAAAVLLPANYRQLTSTYNFPKVRAPGPFGNTTIPADQRDAISNDQGILKLQYTKTLGANALFKVYGYTYYSDWLQIGAQSGNANYFGPAGPDYELSSHTRGLSGTFSDQLGSKNLLQIQGSYTTSTALRDNNTQFFNGGATPDARSTLAVLVDSKNPLNGICYTAQATPTTCAYGDNTKNAQFAQFATLNQAYNNQVTPAPSGACGTGPCSYLVTNNGQYATYNLVKPKFTSASITDQFRPTDRLSIDAGIRLDVFQFEGADTTNSLARQFWYTAYNLDNCLDAQNALHDKITDLGYASPTTKCGPGLISPNFTNPSGIVTQTYPEFQPRLGFTYSLNPSTVVRASYGRYAQPPNTASEQYDALQANAPALLYGTYGFQQFGFTTPDHAVRPSVSNNYDLSFEKSFGDTSLKISPFYRSTQDQIQNFYLNQQTGFVSGLNVGRQTANGVEFELDRGNFARNGVAAKFSFTYTNSYIRYTSLANGSTIIDPLNNSIKTYNGYTSFCAGHAKDAACTTPASGPAAPCYTPMTTSGGGTPIASAAACTAADVANPYWNAPIQGLLDPSGNYHTYDIFPAGIGSEVTGYGAPYFATLILQYKHGPLSVTPNVQFAAGERYGAPETTFGVTPDSCTATVGSTAGDARYSYGSAGGSAFDATSCGQLTGGIPDPFTRRFDSIGAFVAPANVAFGTQLQYDFTNKVSLVANLSNLVNTCFGGTKTGFTVPGACNYGVLANGSGGGVGNLYNPGAAIQPYINSPYLPQFSTYPFSVSVSAKVRI